MIKPEGKIKENSLLLWAVSQLLTLSNLLNVEPRHGERDFAVVLNLPGIANPNVKATINKNKNLIKEFCDTFSNEDEPYIKFLVAVFQFLLGPSPERYITISKLFQMEERFTLLFKRTVSSILQFPPDEKKLYSYYKDISTFSEYYKSEEQYEKDLEELNELINKDSRKVKNHPYKLLTWIVFNSDPTIEEYLDSEILNEIKAWLQNRGLSENALCLCPWYVTVKSDLELYGFTLEIIARQLTKKPRRLKVTPMIAWYMWPKEKTKKELIVANHLKSILKKVLANYSTIIDPQHRQLEILYWSALGAGVISEKYMSELYKIVRNDPHFPSRQRYAERTESFWPTLVNMLKNNDLEVARLAADSLSLIPRRRFFLHEHKRFEEAWVGDKYWEFAQNKDDPWRPRYILGMAQCQLKWTENGQKWLEAIKEGNADELQHAWCQVISEAGYSGAKERDALLNLLFRILDSGDTFTKPIRSVALRRLDQMVSEVEPVEFDEEPLNLPLSQRSSF